MDQKPGERSTARDGALPVLRIGNVQERIDLDDLLYVSGLSPTAIEKKRVSAGWTLIVGSNGNRRRIGNGVFIAADTDFLFASFLLAARPKPGSRVSDKFFARWIETAEVQGYLSATSEGTTGLSNLEPQLLQVDGDRIPTGSRRSRSR